MAKRKLEIDLTIDGKQAKIEIGNINGLTKTLTKNVNTAGHSLSNIGNIVTGVNSAIQIGSSVVGSMGAVLEKYTEFDAGLKNVNTILKVSNEQLAIYGDQLLDISTDTGKSGKDLTDAMYQAVSAGIPAGEAIEFVGIAAKAAIAGLSSTETAVDGVSTVLNAFHKDASDATEVSDIMFQTVALGKTTFDELSSNFSKVASLAYSNKISFEEVSAATATLTKQGVPTSEAMTQIKSSIVSMNKVLGDGWAETMTYQEGLQAVADKAGGSQNELKNLLGTNEAVNATLALTGENAAMASEDLDAMTSSVGAMNTAFETQTDSIEFKMNRLSTTIDNIGISFVDSFAAPLSDLLDNIDMGIKGLGILIGSTKVDGIALGGGSAIDWMDSLKKTTKEFREGELAKTKEDLEKAQAEFARIVGENAMDNSTWGIFGSEESTTEIEAKINTLQKYTEAIESYDTLSKMGTGKKGTGKGGGGKTALDIGAPSRPSIEVASDSKDTNSLIESIEEDNEREIQSYLAKYDKLREAKDIYLMDEKTKRDLGLYEIEVAAMTEAEIKQELLDTEIQQQELLNQIKDASTQKELQRLQKEKDIVDAKLGLIKSETDAGVKKDKQLTKGANVYYDNQLSLVDNLKNMVTKRIKAYVAEAVVGYVSSVVASTGPFALLAGPAAYLAVTELMEGIIPSFDVGVRDFDGGFAKVHKDETMFLPYGSNVYTTEDSRTLDRILANEQRGNSVIRMERNNISSGNNEAVIAALEKQTKQQRNFIAEQTEKQSAFIAEQTERLATVERRVNINIGELNDALLNYQYEEGMMGMFYDVDSYGVLIDQEAFSRVNK